jgi:hypothetical protein
VKVNPVNHIVLTLGGQVVNILFATYVAVCTTLLYLDLRIRKEGYDLEMAALQPKDVDVADADDRYRDQDYDGTESDKDYPDEDDRYRDDRR